MGYVILAFLGGVYVTGVAFIIMINIQSGGGRPQNPFLWPFMFFKKR